MNNAETTRHVIGLVTEFRFDDIEEFIHDDIVVDCPYQAFHAGPLKRGRDNFMVGMRSVGDVFKSFQLNIHELYDCPGQDTVVFEQTSMGVFATNGGTYQNRYIMVFKFKDGKIHLWREFFNPEIMNRGMLSMWEDS